ncbi:MAG: hypothetical protein ACNS64_04400 [Candidatus Halalkalibacterium sp. M3_1C_030]
MNTINSTAITYYTGAVLLSAILSAALIIQLEWPASAEIPLCISIFIQLTAIAKSVQNMIRETGTDTILEAFTLIKEDRLDSKSGC